MSSAMLLASWRATASDVKRKKNKRKDCGTILWSLSAMQSLHWGCTETISNSDALSSLSSKSSEEKLPSSTFARSWYIRNWRRCFVMVLCWRKTVPWSRRFSDRSCSMQWRIASKVAGVRTLRRLADSNSAPSCRHRSRSAARACWSAVMEREVRSRRSAAAGASSPPLLRLAGSLDQRDKLVIGPTGSEMSFVANVRSRCPSSFSISHVEFVFMQIQCQYVRDKQPAAINVRWLKLKPDAWKVLCVHSESSDTFFISAISNRTVAHGAVRLFCS